MRFLKTDRVLPAKIILWGFLLLILAGAVLLTLPAATRDGQGASLPDALFTAVSATCVTGLVIHDTATYWTVFGQAVILLLIQVGGMGVVTMAVAIAMLTGRRIGIGYRFVMQESISAPQVGGIVRLTGFIVKSTLLFELGGALLLSFRFCPQMGLAEGIWNAIFHSVSAFCNAGFDLMGKERPFSSLTGYPGDPLVNLPILALIVIGGMGFFVWDDLRRNRWRLRSYRLQTKLVLSVTGALILLPFLYFLCYEFSRPQWAGLSAGERVLASLFQTVTPRTAGFNTVDLTRMSAPSVLIIILLMLIGGSPGSTAGGFKTTTLASILLCMRSVFRGEEHVQGFGRRVPSETLRSALTLFALYLSLFLLGGMLICCVDGVPLEAALFEAASAIGTVGLSLGITGELGGFSRLLLMGLMYFGRVGGLTMLYAVANGHLPAPSMLPKEKYAVG